MQTVADISIVCCIHARQNSFVWNRPAFRRTVESTRVLTVSPLSKRRPTSAGVVRSIRLPRTAQGESWNLAALACRGTSFPYALFTVAIIIPEYYFKRWSSCCTRYCYKVRKNAAQWIAHVNYHIILVLLLCTRSTVYYFANRTTMLPHVIKERSKTLVFFTFYVLQVWWYDSTTVVAAVHEVLRTIISFLADVSWLAYKITIIFLSHYKEQQRQLNRFYYSPGPLLSEAISALHSTRIAWPSFFLARDLHS